MSYFFNQIYEHHQTIMHHNGHIIKLLEHYHFKPLTTVIIELFDPFVLFFVRMTEAVQYLCLNISIFCDLELKLEYWAVGDGGGEYLCRVLCY